MLLNFNAKPLAFINTIRSPHVLGEENYHTTHFTLGPNESSVFPIISRKNLQKKIKQKRSFSITASKYTNVTVHKVITFHKSHILNKIIQVKASHNFVTLQHNLGLSALHLLQQSVRWVLTSAHKLRNPKFQLQYCATLSHTPHQSFAIIFVILLCTC